MGYKGTAATAFDELFPAAPDCLPQAFAGETLYSWCARYHRLNGSNNPRVTSRRLFGHSTAGLRPELPSHLANFQNNTHQHLGCLDELLTQRTVLGVFAPFLARGAMAEISRHLSSGNSVAARALLGLSKSGQATRTSLRFCPECINEQLAAYAVTWWQTKNLWPSICICQQHGCLLVQAKDELLHRSSADFFLAHELDASRLNLPPDAPSAQLQLLDGIATWTTTLVQHINGGLDESALRLTYLLQAKKRGWLALDGSLRLKALQESFLSQCAMLATVPAFHFVKDADGINGGFLGSLYRQYPGHRHPSKHIVLMNFLFAEPDEFFKAYATVERTISEAGIQSAQKLVTDTSRKLIKLIEQAGHSVSSAAGVLDIPAEEALAHLNRRNDVARLRRPHIVGTPREIQLREMLRDGRTRTEIAESLSLRPTFIKDYLAQRPELKAQWEAAHTARETEKHRTQLVAALNAHPGLPIKTIRRLPKNGFQWLYNNDREWLQEVLPAIWKR
ncbi:TnsD family Tn7-like transposition protein [Dechloromonas denitrificans]|uniref:TnsD family Tn7-like transposition protein n=1 Tax=Dechloromonas denitrificans TaxID=281362 RepID=UPI001CF9F032|nr:TnsD family Tn7-like transposition protein [Dechloromonas denitrificans]UCV08534.1 TniQ family protein [Dechloromonas denitrificans]